MVEAAAQSGKREVIKHEILAKAKGYFETFDRHNIVLEVPERNYVAR